TLKNKPIRLQAHYHFNRLVLRPPVKVIGPEKILRNRSRGGRLVPPGVPLFLRAMPRSPLINRKVCPAMKLHPWVLVGVALPLALLSPSVKSLFDTAAVAGEGQPASYVDGLVIRAQQFLGGDETGPASAAVVLAAGEDEANRPTT